MAIKYFLLFWTSLILTPQAPEISQPYVDSITHWNKTSWEKVYAKPDTSVLLSRKALILSQAIDYHEGSVKSAKLLGIAHDVTSHLDSALYYYHFALNISRSINDNFSTATLLSNAGLVYLHKGDLLNSLKNFLEARKYFEVIAPGSSELAHTSNNLGIIYTRLEDFSKALSLFNQALPIFEKQDDKRGKGALLNNLSVIYSKMGRFNDAVNTLKESIEIKKETDDLHGLCIAYNKMGSLMLDYDSLDQALVWLDKTIALANKIDNQNTIVSAYHLKVRIFERQENYSKAIRYNRMALDMALELGTRRSEADSYYYFSTLYKKTGDYFNAHSYLQRYLDLKDSLTSKEQISEVYELQLKFEMEKKDDEISLLLEQQKVQELELANKQLLIEKRNQLIFIVSGGLGLLLLLLYSRHVRYKHVQKLKMELALMNSKEQQTKKVLEAEVKERKRIGEDLHDGLGQILSLVKMNITDHIDNLPLDENQQQKRFRSLLTLTDNAFNELRNVSHNLSPILLQEKGLAVSIKDLVNRLRKSKKYNIELDISGMEHSMDPVIEHSIYRIVQELLSNIMRHADAKNISLQLVCDNNELSLIVEDDGKGFDLSKDHTGMGLKNLKTRIENLGGTVDIDSLAERGTIISIMIPLKDPKIYV